MTAIPFSSAAERNRQPILEQLQRWLPGKGTVLEIGSGTGQHAVFFASHLHGIKWQPSDRQENLPGLQACFTEAANDNILPMLQLDVINDPWPQRTYAGVYSANTAHIMSWEAVVAMFTGVADRLVNRGRFFLYGPFNINRCFTSDSNEQFDRSLRARDPDMGIRDMEVLESLANTHHMELEQKLAMPANNFILVFKKS